MHDIESVYINEKRIYAFKSKNEFLDTVVDIHAILISMNAESIMCNNREFTQIINNNIAFTDGIGAVIGLKHKGINTVKIPGVEIWLEIIKWNLRKKFYLIGSTSRIIDEASDKLERQFNINLVGKHNGFFSESEYIRIEKDIFDTKPEIVFIGIGQPKQELIANRLFEKHKALYVCIGGSFDIYTGVKKRAPAVFLNLHLEWLYRLLKEPARLRRQLALVRFLILLKLGKI